tara:strand:- start:1495 stop:1623 length:129 start_codon:yes stop_codon:yes gene_type:complete
LPRKPSTFALSLLGLMVLGGCSAAGESAGDWPQLSSLTEGKK